MLFQNIAPSRARAAMHHGYVAQIEKTRVDAWFLSCNDDPCTLVALLTYGLEKPLGELGSGSAFIGHEIMGFIQYNDLATRCLRCENRKADIEQRAR